jgi:hypothetical protein
VPPEKPRKDPEKKAPKPLNYGRPGEPAAGAAEQRPSKAAAPAEPPLGEAARRALEEIGKLLWTGVTDWVVTDADTEAVHAHLEALGREDFMRVCRRLAAPSAEGECLLAKYLTRGVIDHSGGMQARWSEQFDRKVYYEAGAYKSFDTLRTAYDFERAVAAAVGAALWSKARLPPSQPLRGILAELKKPG